MREPNFFETMKRMYTDALLLYNHEEYYNSCYLSGYVVECALKHILCTYAKKDSTPFLWQDAKGYLHKNHKLNEDLTNYLSITEGVPQQYRIDYKTLCPFIIAGRQGKPPWDPKYRYGELEVWEEKDYCAHYIDEIKKMHAIVCDNVMGGL